MTKVVKSMVKCAKCGMDSEQLIVYSVNFRLGDKESNERLMKHKQVCPHCKYEAASINDPKLLANK